MEKISIDDVLSLWSISMGENIGTQGVQDLFFCDLKAPRGCSARWTGLLTDIIRVTHSCILVPDSSQYHYRVKYSCTNFDDCCP